MLVVWMAFLLLAGILIQVRMGYDRFEIGLYLTILFGLQLSEYLLFALLALPTLLVDGGFALRGALQSSDNT